MTAKGVVKRKALLTDGVVEETPKGIWMRCLCDVDSTACTLHDEGAVERWRIARALRKALAAGAVGEISGTLQ